jgi:two-component system, NarL family, nitrate/nitrite response regulator NarL
VTAHRFRPELVLVDATIGLDGSPTVVGRILQAYLEAKVIVLGEDRDVDLCWRNQARRRRRGRKSLWDDRGTAGGRGGVGRRGRRAAMHARGAHSASGRPGPGGGLAAGPPFARERQVLALLSQGWDNSRIGNQLFISQHTVRTHIQNTLQKLGVHSKLEAATLPCSAP